MSHVALGVRCAALIDACDAADCFSASKRASTGPRAWRLLDEVARKLARRTDLSVAHNACRLTVLPLTEAGFPIVLDVIEAGCHVNFGGCTQDFDDVEQACARVLDAVTANVRLRIDVHGDVPYQWSLERQQGRSGEVMASSGPAQLLGWLWPSRARQQVLHYGYAAAV